VGAQWTLQSTSIHLRLEGKEHSLQLCSVPRHWLTPHKASLSVLGQCGLEGLWVTWKQPRHRKEKELA
jgi:hypothetical protein